MHFQETGAICLARNGPKDTASSYPGSLACCSILPPGLIDPAIHRVSALLVLVLPAGYCRCHSPMAVAMLCLAGHTQISWEGQRGDVGAGSGHGACKLLCVALQGCEASGGQ